MDSSREVPASTLDLPHGRQVSVDMLLGETLESRSVRLRRVSQSELIGYLGSPASFPGPGFVRRDTPRSARRGAPADRPIGSAAPTAPDRRDHAPNYAKPEWSVGTAAVEAAHPEQISSVIGNAFWQLPAGVQALASSPLMLGLLRSLPEDRIRTASEDSVLSGYVGAVVSRQVQRGGHVADEVTGRHLAEEAALAWLSSDRVAIDGETLRQVSVTVAQGLAGRRWSPTGHDCDRTVVGREWACRP